MDEIIMLEEVVDYLSDRCKWADFISFMEEKGYSQSDFPPPYNED